MDTYIESLFKKEVTNDIVESKNTQTKAKNIITKNAINNFYKQYDITLTKNSEDYFRKVYDNVVKDTFDIVNASAKKRDAKYIGLTDIKSINMQQNGGMTEQPYADYCHNNLSQCSDMYNVGCGQKGGSLNTIPLSVFGKLAQSHVGLTIPKNVLKTLQPIIEKSVANIIKNDKDN